MRILHLILELISIMYGRGVYTDNSSKNWCIFLRCQEPLSVTVSTTSQKLNQEWFEQRGTHYHRAPIFIKILRNRTILEEHDYGQEAHFQAISLKRPLI